MIDTPSTKVTAGALAGALTALIVWAVGQWTAVDVPPEAAVAGTVVISFLLSYLIRETTPAPSAVAEINERQTPLAGPLLPKRGPRSE